MNRFYFTIIIVLTSIKTFSQFNVDILVVAGGGGGGFRHAGGGGAGGLQYVTNQSINSGQSYAVAIGSGGTGGSANNINGTNGGNSSFGGLILSNGGGGGASNRTTGSNGGSGGGGVNGMSGGTGISGQGFKGGDHNNGVNCCWGYGAGGGGAAEAAISPLGNEGSNGGNGRLINITGTDVYYAGGGGAGHGDPARTTFYNGGLGGGGKGGNSSTIQGTNGTPNTGGGGGGGGANNTTSGNGGNGGSGIVIIRYASQSPLSTSGTRTSYVGNGTNGINGVTYQVHTFTANGTFVLNSIISTQPSSTNQNICINGTASALTVAGTGTSITYQWYSNTANSNIGGTLISGATSASYTPPTSTAGTTYYYCVVTNSTTTQTSNVSGAVIISTPSIAGTVSGGNTVTAGTNSTILTTSGNTGSIQWQSSTNNITYINISGATATSYTATNLSATTYYRAMITNGGCASVYTSNATILVTPAPSAATTMSITGSSTTLSLNNNIATVVDPALAVTSDGTLTGFTVTISDNYTSGDVLDYTGTLPSGVTAAAFNTTSRSLVFSGSTTAANWQALLRTVRLRTTSVTCNPESRKVTFSSSSNYFNYFNGHYYEYSPVIRSWTDAKAYAASRTFYGRQGYLVTITSAIENSFVSSLINFDTWLGCSDNVSQINGAVGYNKYSNQNNAEGKWHWITGPEKGVQIRTGNASTAEKPGGPISGVYQNWNTATSYGGNEPNDVWSLSTPGQEDYGHLWANSGKWNDFPNRGRACIVEFGDMPGDNPITTLEFVRNISVIGATSGSISGGNATVCPAGSATLTLTGATGTVSRWEASEDNFLNQIDTIISNSNTLSLTNLSTSKYYRAIVTNGSCVLATNAQYVNVTQLFAGTVTANANQTCAGSAISLTLNGSVGNVSKWQFATDTNGTKTDIASTSKTISQTLATAGNYFFRAIVGSVTCASTANSDWYPVTVSSGGAPTGGAVTTNYHCGVNNSGVLQLIGASGGTYQWQFSTDGGTTYSNVGAASTQNNLAYSNITQNRRYRVLVSNGACGSSYSSVGGVELYGTNICQWTGAVDSIWNNTSNWCAGIIADDGRSIDISPEARFNIVLDTNRFINTLSFNNSSKKIILGKYELAVNSIIGGDSFNFILTNSTGKLKSYIPQGSTFLFPVGRNTYTPVSIKNNNASADSFFVRISDSVLYNGTSGAPFLTPHVRKTWHIDKKTTSNTGGVDFTFGWFYTDESSPLSSYYLNHYRNTGGWELPTPTIATSIDGDTFKTFTFNGYTGTFSPFAIGGGNVALSVALKMFMVKCQNDYKEINWTTASEIRNKAFELFKSDDAQDWKLIHTIGGQGTKATETHYQFNDLDKKAGYYRLKDIDEDGIENWSQIVFADCKEKTTEIQIYPNPATDYIKVIAPFKENTILKILNLEGKIVKTMSLVSNQTLVSVKDLTKGIYMIELNSSGEKIKFVKD